MVNADVSSYGLGAALLKLHGSEWKPAAFIHFICASAFIHFIEPERQYVHIEKEYLTNVWACENFYKYLCGLGSFKPITNHRPLGTFLNGKDLVNH